MSIKSRETLYGAAVRHKAEAAKAHLEADHIACEAWNMRMLAFQGPAQSSPTLGDALNADCRYLEIGCLAAIQTRPFRSTSFADEQDLRR